MSTQATKNAIEFSAKSTSERVIQTRVAVVIPTYNEEWVLNQAIQSILTNISSEQLTIFVINSGKPLDFNNPNIIEIRTPETYFWGDCIKHGLDEVRKRINDFDFVMFANADNCFLDNSINALLKAATAHPGAVISSPGYTETAEGNLELEYSNYKLASKLLLVYERQRLWENSDSAPTEPIQIPLIAGGQGVLFPIDLLDSFDVDSLNFHHYIADVDFWISMYLKGIKFFVAPQAGIINIRPLGLEGKETPARLKLSHIFSKRSPYWWKIHWLLRKKHFNPLWAFTSTVIVLTVLYSTKFLFGTKYRVLDRSKRA